jgi:hypothetical protein
MLHRRRLPRDSCSHCDAVESNDFEASAFMAELGESVQPIIRRTVILVRVIAIVHRTVIHLRSCRKIEKDALVRAKMRKDVLLQSKSNLARLILGYNRSNALHSQQFNAFSINDSKAEVLSNLVF